MGICSAGPEEGLYLALRPPSFSWETGAPSEQPLDPVLKIVADSHALAGIFHGLTAANVKECIDQRLFLPYTNGFSPGLCRNFLYGRSVFPTP